MKKACLALSKESDYLIIRIGWLNSLEETYGLIIIYILPRKKYR